MSILIYLSTNKPNISNIYSFLLGSRSGPSISAHIAHEHIAFACVSQLIQILEFAQSESREDEIMEAVGLGCLGLQRYASENWTFHIQKYTELSHTELNPEVPLMRQLLRLATRHNELSGILKPHVTENAQDLASTLVTDTWLQGLGAFPGVCDLFGRIHCFQDLFSAQQRLTGPGMRVYPFY